MAFVYRMFCVLCAALLLPAAAIAAPKPQPNPLSSLQGEALTYYVQSFNSTMERGKPDVPYTWKTVGGKGQIVAGAAYMSKSKALCRDYSESYVLGAKIGAAPTVPAAPAAPTAPAPAGTNVPPALPLAETASSTTTTGTATGVACQRSAQGGWCRLGANDARTCALEKPQTGYDRALGFGRSMLR